MTADNIADSLEAPVTRTEMRLKRVELQRVDAAKVRSEIEAAKIARDEKTVRLRALRLAKEASDREAMPPATEKVRKRRK